MEPGFGSCVGQENSARRRRQLEPANLQGVFDLASEGFVARQKKDLAGSGEFAEQLEGGAAARVVHAQQRVVEDQREALSPLVEMIDESEA